MIKRNEEQKHFTRYSACQQIRVHDKQTTLFLYSENDITIVKVDGGIIGNDVKKCDYLSNSKICTNFIELKGTNINEAYGQIESTINVLQADDKYKYLINNQKANAIIVSPIHQKIPRGSDSKQRALAKKIAKLNKEKVVSDINDYILYVTIKPSLQKVIRCKNCISCSGRAPLVID